MKIVTLNTWKNDGPFKERWSFLIDGLLALNPDILCLQEVFEYTLFEKIKKETSLSYGFTCHEAGLVTLSRQPITFSQVLKYKTISPLENESRSGLLTNLQMEQEQVLIANTHLSWRSEDLPIRLGQARELIQAIRKLNQPALLAGDFNDEPISEPIREIKDAGYLDLYELCGKDTKALTWDNQNPFIQGHSVKFPDRRIDFLFAYKSLLPRLEIQNCEIIFKQPNVKGIYVSDHYGVLAEIKIKSAL